MTVDWLDGFTQVDPAPTAYPGTMLNVPRRWVGHSTEVFTRDPLRALSQHANPPHCWVTLPSHEWAPKTRGQVYPLSKSARALDHPKGSPLETNKMGALQVEIEGFADDLVHLSQYDLDWLADEVIGPMCAAGGVDVSVFMQGNPSSSMAYGKNSPTRMSVDQWWSYNGLCSHQNVPTNDHWDAGGLDLSYISHRLTGGSPVPPEEDDMAGKWHRWVHEVQGRQYAVLEQGGCIVGKVAIPSEVYAGIYTRSELGPFEASDDFQNNGGRLDALPWLGAAPPWADLTDEQILAEVLKLPKETVAAITSALVAGKG